MAAGIKGIEDKLVREDLALKRNRKGSVIAGKLSKELYRTREYWRPRPVRAEVFVLFPETYTVYNVYTTISDHPWVISHAVEPGHLG